MVTLKSRMAEMEYTMALMTQKLRILAPAMVPRVPNLYLWPPGRHQRGMTNITFKNYDNNRQGDWGHQLRRRKREESIRIMFQNVVNIGIASEQTSKHK